MVPDADATRIAGAMMDSGSKPLHASLTGLNRAASAKVKQLMEQLDGQLRVICVPGRSSKGIASEVLQATHICGSSTRKVLENQQEERLGQLLDGWKEAAASTLNTSLSTLREELTQRARLHGTISNDRVTKMHKIAKHDAMTSAERQVWSTLAPQLISSNDRVAELEGSMAELRLKADDAERAASLCVGSASEQAKLMLQQLSDMSEALNMKDLMWRRQRQRNVECEQRVAEVERKAADAGSAAALRQQQYQTEVAGLHNKVSSLDPSRTGGVPLKTLVTIVETQLGLPAQADSAISLSLSAAHRALGDAPELAGWHTIGTRQKVAALAEVLGIETGWPVQDRVGSQQQYSAAISAPPAGRTQQPLMRTMSQDDAFAAARDEELQHIAASVQIQRIYRGNHARHVAGEAKQQNEGALRIQRHRRGQVDRRFFEHQRAVRERAEAEGREARRVSLMAAQDEMERQLANMKTMTGKVYLL